MDHQIRFLHTRRLWHEICTYLQLANIWVPPILCLNNSLDSSKLNNCEDFLRSTGPDIGHLGVQGPPCFSWNRTPYYIVIIHTVSYSTVVRFIVPKGSTWQVGASESHVRIPQNSPIQWDDSFLGRRLNELVHYQIPSQQSPQILRQQYLYGA